jgi:two-component system OmpR family sensor kinase
MLLAFIYLQLRRSLKPLGRLEADIRRYGEGKALRPRPELTNGNDEIARLARAFYEAEEKLRRLGDSRRLFLRNILHELNTPVTKGKLLAEISEEPRTREMLHSIFGRLTLLLEELARVERLAAATEALPLRPVRIVDLIDQARDRLYREEPIPYEGPDRAILADFASMAIVFKNLIDNGLKYGGDLRIRLRGDSLEFVSRGEALARELDWYLEPFSREESGGEGFGLGLYIVREILRRQGMELGYRHENGTNLFVVAPIRYP